MPHPIIKVMIHGRFKRHGTRQWCVAAGDVPKPTRGCLWFALAFFAAESDAARYYAKLDARNGRALLNLDNPRLRFISPEGKVVRCLETEARLLS